MNSSWKSDINIQSLSFQMNPSEQGKIYFASDFHLGAPDEKSSTEREKKLCRWLDSISKDATEIYLLGDLFDFWFEYKDVVPKGNVRFLGKLAELSDAGIAITLFKGNHDMWSFGYFQKELGVRLISNELITEMGGKRFFLHHGDGLGPGDNSYKILKKIFRNKLCIALFGFLHPAIGTGIASYFSRRSRINTGANDKQFLGEENEFIIQYCKDRLKSEHFDYFICGHRHLPISLPLSTNSTYVNLGEWISDFNYAVFDGTNLELKVFKG